MIYIIKCQETQRFKKSRWKAWKCESVKRQEKEFRQVAENEKQMGILCGAYSHIM